MRPKLSIGRQGGFLVRVARPARGSILGAVVIPAEVTSEATSITVLVHSTRDIANIGSARQPSKYPIIRFPTRRCAVLDGQAALIDYFAPVYSRPVGATTALCTPVNEEGVGSERMKNVCISHILETNIRDLHRGTPVIADEDTPNAWLILAERKRRAANMWKQQLSRRIISGYLAGPLVHQSSNPPQISKDIDKTNGVMLERSKKYKTIERRHMKKVFGYTSPLL